MAHPVRSAPPQAEGLYDPRYEHDACGVGFVVNIKGVRSHAVVERGLEVLINLQHRGACGSEANTGDGAGILIQPPDRFLRKVANALGIGLPPAGPVRRRQRLPAARMPTSENRSRRSSSRWSPRKARRCSAGGRCRPTQHMLGPSAAAVMPVVEQLFVGYGGDAPGRASLQADPMRFERKLYVIRKRIEHAADKLALTERHMFYIPSLSSKTLIYKGMLTADQIQPTFPGSDRSRRRVGARARPPALQHEHVPVVAAGAPVSLHRAQRRDQHAARQHQLDAGARRPAPVRRVRRRSQEDPADHPRRRQRHRHLRQRPRVPLHGRAVAAARHPDDDSGAVVGAREHEPRAQGVLRVPLVADGAVGRPGVDRVHRRHAHRRGARSQRPASVALLRDQGRPGRHGVGSRRARHSGRGHRRQGAPAPGPHLPHRHRQGPHRRRRRNQERAGVGAAVRALAGANISSTSRICRRLRICRRRATKP